MLLLFNKGWRKLTGGDKMLRHFGLYNPVVQTAEMKDKEFTKYVDICRREQSNTPNDVLKRIRDHFFDFASGKAKKNHILDVWDYVEPMLAKNQGLAQFTLDYHGDESQYFFQWLRTVHESPARALEMSYGSGYNLSGTWETSFIDDTEDPINHFVRNDPTFVYNRQRQLYVADLASTVYDRAWDSSSPRKIVDFGAGALAWARWHGYEFVCPNQDWVEINAFDIDKTINPYDFFDGSKLNIHYRKGDLMSQMDNPECRDADLVILSGVATYLPAGELVEVIKAIFYLLYDEASLFFDLQVDCPYLQRSIELWGWPKMNLPQNAATAIANVEEIRRHLWSNGYKFGAEYVVDTYNNTPSAVMVTFTRI